MESQNDIGVPWWLLPGLIDGHHHKSPLSSLFVSSAVSGRRGQLDGGRWALRRTVWCNCAAAHKSRYMVE